MPFSAVRLSSPLLGESLKTVATVLMFTLFVLHIVQLPVQSVVGSFSTQNASGDVKKNKKKVKQEADPEMN